MSAKLTSAARLGAAILLVGCALYGCTSTPEKPTQAQLVTQAVQQTEALEKSGNLLAAAREYRRIAAPLSSPLRETLQMRALHLLVRGQAYGEADVVYLQIDQRQVPATEIPNLRMDGAQAAGARDEWETALSRLDLGRQQWPDDPALLRRYHELRAEALLRAGDPLASAGERLRMEPLLATDPVARRGNHLALLQALDKVPRFAVEDAWNGADPTTRSWLQLSLMVKGYPSNAEELDANVELWRLQHPQNPLEAEVLTQFLAELKQRHLPPARVALILPGTGPFAEAAGTLRDGFLSAYFADPPELRPKVTILPRGETDDVRDLYARAVREGAEVVVGPLDKDAVTQLGSSESLPIPVLALNRSESLDSSLDNFYQFGLPPEEEALQVAQRARGAGYQHALVLVPKGAWGARLATAFATHWSEMSGTVLEQKTYAPKENDHSDPIVELLNLDESTERRRALRAVVGEPIEFEPRRRRDAEFVFLGAFPRQARSLRPQLQFHHAGDLPLYATSHVFSGRPDPERDADMNGLEFCDMPWLLETSTAQTDLSPEAFEQLWPADRVRFIRLYALGMDAYRLLAHLTRLRDDPQNVYDGHTGRLRMDGRGHLRRELPWASFSQGRPSLLGYPPQEQPTKAPTEITPPGFPQPQRSPKPPLTTG